MAKRVLIISASPRERSNSDALAESYRRGAEEAGAEVETVRLRDIELAFCRGCLACQRTKRCVIDDGAVALADKVNSCDVLVLATPIYYYSVSGQLKTALDRMNPLYGGDYAFRDVVLLASAADDEPTAVRGAVKAVQGWVDCFKRAELTGVVFAGGVNDPGDIEGHAALNEAYEAGKRL